MLIGLGNRDKAKGRGGRLVLWAALAAMLLALTAAPAEAVSRRGGLEEMSESDRNALRYLESKLASNPSGQFAIGMIYKRNGEDDRARRWLKQSADAGNPNARAMLSSLAASQAINDSAIKANSRRAMVQAVRVGQ
ncbi:MAG: hypothetical protein HZC25_09940 [Rhodospirillales bacterium]|nr:hypothetical protein [Rhodospirillales bacterium]